MTSQVFRHRQMASTHGRHRNWNRMGTVKLIDRRPASRGIGGKGEARLTVSMAARSRSALPDERARRMPEAPPAALTVKAIVALPSARLRRAEDG